MFKSVLGELCGAEGEEIGEIRKWYREYRKSLLPEVKITLSAGKIFLKFFSVLTRKSVSELQHLFENSKIAPLRGSSLALRLVSTIGFYRMEKAERETGYYALCDDYHVNAEKQFFSESPQGNYIEAEAVIVGSGAGGAAAGYELAKNGVDVVIIEEGKEWMTGKDFLRIHPSEIAQKLYVRGGFVTTAGNTFILLPTGKGVGGTTTINSGTCFRTPERVLDTWKNLYSLREFDKEELEGIFKEIEGDLGVGPVPEELLSRSSKIVREGAENLNLHFKPLMRNAPRCRGCGRCAFGCPSDAKKSMNLSYVPMAMKFKARVYTGIRVKKAIIKNGNVEYLEGEILQDGFKRKCRIKGKIYFICAGALNTPFILKSSGIKNPHIARNLLIHPATRVLGIMDDEVEGWRGVPQGAYIDDFEGEGIMLEGIFVPPFAAAINFPFCGKELREKMKEEYRRASAFGVMISEEDSKGRVYFTPHGRPLMIYNIGKKDHEKILKGIRVLANIFISAGAKKIYIPVRGMQVLKDKRDIERIDAKYIRVRDLELGAFHPMGTVFMGGEETGAPVDGNGRVRNVKNLIVADTSVFPTSPHVNPQITCMALSRLFARRWLEGR